MAIKRDYKANPPKKLTELNKDSMLAYVQGLNDKEEIKFIVKLFDDNQKAKTYQFDTKTHKKGDELSGYDMPKIRKAFAKRYFPDMLKKKEYKKTDDFKSTLDKMREEIK